MKHAAPKTKKHHSKIVPMFIAAFVAAVAAVAYVPSGADAAPTLVFSADFSTSDDFYNNFDYGYSGHNPMLYSHGNPVIKSFHGDHNQACEGPTTDRVVNFKGGEDLDYSELFWHCAPGNDTSKGHIMTAVDTFGYNMAWFSPKSVYSQVGKVCWDINETQMSQRKWTQVVFVSESDAKRYPKGRYLGTNNVARGSGGYDLGFTNPSFRDSNGPTTMVHPTDRTSGVQVTANGSVHFWDDAQGGFTGPGWGDIMPREYRDRSPITDKAARFQHCVENLPNNQVRITRNEPEGQVTATARGQIPQGRVRVVFQDDNYDGPKDDNYQANVVTWHWDNIQVFTESGSTSTTTPTTAAPSTTSTTAPPSTTTTAPVTTTTTTTRPSTTTTSTTSTSTTTTTAPPPVGTLICADPWTYEDGNAEVFVCPKE